MTSADHRRETAETITSAETPERLEPIAIDKPTVSMFASREREPSGSRAADDEELLRIELVVGEGRRRILRTGRLTAEELLLHVSAKDGFRAQLAKLFGSRRRSGVEHR
jgi:hypothetical protein